MRNGQLFFSAAEFLLIIALFLSGAFFFGLHFIPAARLELAEWIMNSPDHFLWIGSSIGGAALLLALCFWAIHRHKFFRIEMEKAPFFLDEGLVKGVIEQFWEEEFPEEKKGIEVFCAREKIEVIASAPRVDNLEECLYGVEERLGRRLAEQLGYEEKFYLTLRL